MNRHRHHPDERDRDRDTGHEPRNVAEHYAGTGQTYSGVSAQYGGDQPHGWHAPGGPHEQWERDDGRHAEERHGRQPRHDPRYRAWRERQLSRFDAEYEEYRRERQEQFDTDFDSWRAARAARQGAKQNDGPA